MPREAMAALVLAACVLAGCVAPTADLAPAGNDAPRVGNPWELGLADEIETPERAPRRSAAERRADVVPAGDPRYAAFDAVIVRFMESTGIGAANVAVLRDGQLRYENGYGHLDEAGTIATPPSAMMRIASLAKPSTAAIVTMLVEEGRMAWDDPVLCLPPTPAAGCLLPIEPHAKRPVSDPRAASLTLRDLVEHRTGWTRDPCTDPILADGTIAIAEELGIASPPPAWRLAQWFIATPFDYEPGTDPGPAYDAYCNMGYLLLGLIAEAKTGATMSALQRAYVFEPLEIAGDIEPGKTRPAERNPREPAYPCDWGMTRSIYPPHDEVCWADGGFDLEGVLAVGGLISTAEGVAAVFEAFENDGTPRDGDGPTVSDHTGGLPGTSTIALRFGDGRGGALGDVQIVLLLNKSDGPPFAPIVPTPLAFQLTQAFLLAAYGGVEANVPAVSAAAETAQR